MRVGAQLAQHVFARSRNRIVRRLRFELCLRAKIGLVDGELVETDIEVGAAIRRRDVAAGVVTRHDMIVNERREGARTPHFDDPSEDLVSIA